MSEIGGKLTLSKSTFFLWKLLINHPECPHIAPWGNVGTRPLHCPWGDVGTATKRRWAGAPVKRRIDMHMSCNVLYTGPERHATVHMSDILIDTWVQQTLSWLGTVFRTLSVPNIRSERQFFLCVWLWLRFWVILDVRFGFSMLNSYRTLL